MSTPSVRSIPKEQFEAMRDALEAEGIQAVLRPLDTLGAEEVERQKKELAPIDVRGTRIGTDDVGKGD